MLGDEQLLEGQRRGPFLVSPAETLGDQPLEVTGHEAKGPLEVLPDHEGQEEQLLHVTMCNEDHPLQTSVVVPDIAQESEVSTRQPGETLGGGKVPNKPC